MCGDTFRHIAFAFLPLVMVYKKQRGSLMKRSPLCVYKYVFQIRATPLARAASAVALATASFTRGSKALGRM